MKRLTLALGLILLAVTAAPLSAAHGRHGAGFHGGFRGGHRGPSGFIRYRPSFWGWGYWYDPWYGPYYPGYYGYGGYGYGGYGYGGYGYGRSRDWAVIDTDVSPESARVYLDGQYIGTADDFDGYPDYLYLRRGHYSLEFRLDGYETRKIDVDARPGVKIDVDDKLAKIPGAPRYGSYEESAPPGGVRRFWSKRGNVAESMTDEDEIYGEPRQRPRDLDRSERYDDRDRDREGEIERDEERAPADAGSWRERAEVEREGAWVRLTVEPADAAIYLDDRFVGTASELDTTTGLSVSPGKHTLVVSRPGYRDHKVQIDLSRGKTERLDIRLER